LLNGTKKDHTVFFGTSISVGSTATARKTINFKKYFLNMSASDFQSTDLCLAFKNISVSNLVPPQPIISNVSGFVKKGGITAVFGASASGKSLLLQALAGRIQNLSITGNVFLNGVAVDSADLENSVSYVPQDSSLLIGDLSAREMITDGVSFKRNAPRECLNQAVDSILDEFGLSHVADTYIGTIFRSGLSGGQKRRVDVAIELVAAPSLLLLDEPTSGLDGSIAYDALLAIRKIVQARPADNSLSVMLNIHQPNSRILNLFDHILVLGSSGMLFFGTVAESVQHFTKIGYAPPEKYTPTDYYLNVTSTNFTANTFDFIAAFNSSAKYDDLMELLDRVESFGQIEQLMLALAPAKSTSAAATKRLKSPQTVGAAPSDAIEEEDEGDEEGGGVPAAGSDPFGSSVKDRAAMLACRLSNQKTAERTSFFTQMYLLVKRDYIIAFRDPTYYYLQVTLILFFGFLIGAVFFQLKYKIDATLTYVPGALLWLVMMMMYIQVQMLFLFLFFFYHY
jgi:ABC-type multidrug transport system ATPase subunit